MSSDGGTAKRPGALLTIREVSEKVGEPPHILRFWETRFAQLRPMQRAGQRRYYRPEDVALVEALSRLLHREGYTVEGVRRLLKAEGVAGVVARGQERPGPAPGAGPGAAPGAAPGADRTALIAIRNRLAAALAA